MNDDSVALLFAVVGAVLEQRAEMLHAAANQCAFLSRAHFALAAAREDDAAETLGWWRSTW